MVLLKLFCVLLILLLVCFSPFIKAEDCMVANNWQQVILNDDQLIIAVMRVNNRPVSESIDLYERDNQFYLPLSQLGFLLNLPWHFDDNEQRFYSNYNQAKYSKLLNTLCEFDFELSETSSSGQNGYWYSDDYDTYLDVQSVAYLLKGEVEFNRQLQQINFSSNEQSLGIKTEVNTLLNTYFNELDVSTYPVVKDEYLQFTTPIINYRLNLRAQNQKASTKFNYQGNLNANFDLLGLSSEYRLINSSQRFTQFLKFSKNITTSDSQVTELSNIQNINERAIKYEVGDISFAGDELVFPTKQVLGAHLYSHSINQRRNFSNIQIEETALPGWRGVLFRNGQFVAEQNADDDNRIVFKEVATFIGLNRFIIQLYGPQGQEEYREQIVHVGQNQKQHKQLDYSVSISDASKRLLEGDIGKGLEAKAYDKHLSSLLSYGVTPRLTAEVQWHELFSIGNEIDNESMLTEDAYNKPSRYLSTSLDYTNWQSLFRARYARNDMQGHAFFMGVNSNLSSTFTGNLSIKYLDNFESQKHNSQQGLQSEIRGRINGRVSNPFNIRSKIGIGFNFSEQRFKTQALKRLLSLNTSQQLIGGTFSNTLQYKILGNDKSVSHRMFLSNDIGRWQLSQSLTWAPLNKQEIMQYSANLRWPQHASIFNETRLTYNKTSSSSFKLSHQMSWRHEFFNLQLGLSVDEDGQWNSNLGISGSLYKNQQSNQYHFTKMKGNNVRRIEAFAFIDNDRDGKLSEQDDPLPDVKFAGAADWREHATNQQGGVQLFSMQDYQSISIEETSLSDPFLAPINSTKIVATHAGGINKVYFALLPVNDIEGMVIVQKNGKNKGLLGLLVRLREIEGEQTWETHTESDGYFYFTHIPPGKYKVEIDAEHLARLELTQTETPIITALEMGDIITLNTLTLVNNDKELK